LEEFLQDPPDPVFDPGGCISGESLRALHKMQQAYKAMVRLIDDQVGRILDTLESRNLLDRTLIIFTSDHGEMLGDHGLLQKGYPQWQSLSIPLAIRLPGSTNRTLNHSPVELTDVTATLLDAAGLDPREALSKSWPSYHNLVPCRSLLPLVRGEVPSIRDWAYAESDARWHSKDPTEESHWQVLQNETWHYQRHVQVRDSTLENYLREKLFHRASDPEYQIDRSTDPSCQNLLQECRRLRDYIASTTPPAQIGWAPLE
jgi:arylsulfatase A-like enzyme